MAAPKKTPFTDSEQFIKGIDLIHQFAEKNRIPYMLVFRDEEAFVTYAFIPEDAPERMIFASAFIQTSAEDTDQASELAMAVMAMNSDQDELRKRIEETEVNPDMDELLQGIMKPLDKEFAGMINSMLFLAAENEVPFTGGMFVENEIVAFTDGIGPDDGLEIFFCPFILAGDVMIPEGIFEMQEEIPE